MSVGNVHIAMSVLDMFDAFVALVLLYLFLNRYAFPPILKAVRDRQVRIAEDLKAAEGQRLEAEALRQELEQQLKDVRLKAEAALARAVHEAEEEARQIVDRARLEAKRLVQDAQGEIEAERDKALGAVRDQVADLALRVAERVLSESVDAALDERLLQRFVDEAGASS
jgi:F-type H+-transporting ATPase subunit b